MKDDVGEKCLGSKTNLTVDESTVLLKSRNESDCAVVMLIDCLNGWER